MLEIPTLNIEALFGFIYNIITLNFFNLNLPPNLFPILELVWFGVGAISLTIIVVIFWKTTKMHYTQDVNLVSLADQPVDTSNKVNTKWMNLVRKTDSDNPADWNLAIIEADKILDEIVKKMSLPGENLGERLKAVEPSDFLTLNDAWKAHKIRNSIAHESDFVLTRRDAQKTLRLYENVFKEFGYL